MMLVICILCGVWGLTIMGAAMDSNPVRTGHAGDCTIYASLVNGTALDGICTCGYGWQRVRQGDWSAMFSKEWLEANSETKKGT